MNAWQIMGTVLHCSIGALIDEFCYPCQVPRGVRVRRTLIVFVTRRAALSIGLLEDWEQESRAVRLALLTTCALGG